MPRTSSWHKYRGEGITTTTPGKNPLKTAEAIRPRVLKKKIFWPRKILKPKIRSPFRNAVLHFRIKILPPLILDRSNNPRRAFRIFISLSLSLGFYVGEEEERDVFREEKLVGKGAVQPQRRKVKSFSFPPR